MDINTIFYFVGTKAEYEQKWQNGDINARTIVFITDTGEIYKNGVRYGGLTRNEVINESTTVVNNNEYDDTEIRNSINRLLGLIDGLNTDLDNLISDKLNDILSIINDVLSEYTWLKKNLGDVFHLSQWVTELQSFLTTNGYLTENGGTWTTLLQTVNSITGRVSSLETNSLTESQIKSWISDGVAGIDLTTFALKSDLVDFLTLTDLNELLNVADFTTAFLSLRSDLDSAMATIGAWSHVNNTDNSIVDLIGALQIQVDNLENSVSTTLSSTVRQYLNNDLSNGISDYLQNQAGLILSSNLDSAVAGLFSQTTSTKTAVEGVVNTITNTAGFMTESDLDGAMATIFALSSGSGAYDSSETYFWFDEGSLADVAHLFIDDITALPVNQTHSLTDMVGHVFDTASSATPLTATEITETITALSESTTNPSVGISYASQANPSVVIGEITRLSKAEAALNKSKLYAAILVGIKNDASFIDMVADGITLSADQVIIDANQTLINYLLSEYVRVGDITGGVTVTADSLQTSIDNNGTPVITNEINVNGSGMLASGNIVWDQYGLISKLAIKQYLDTTNTDPRTIVDPAEIEKIEVTPTLIQMVGHPTYDRANITVSTRTGNIVLSGLGAQIQGVATPQTTINAGSISVNGTISANLVTTIGDLTVGDDLTVTDDASIGGDLTIGGSISGDLTVTGDLNAEYIYAKLPITYYVLNSNNTYDSYTGISKTVKIGGFYMVFINGILTYCSTSLPSDGNFTDPNDYETSGAGLLQG